ncbi:MAG: aminodeoxychorismate synthase component I [Chloroflexi bacterium]|nr:aminodeoxychorismate synthase component I [Chloroflexota bacterium]
MSHQIVIRDATTGQWLRFQDPCQVIEARCIEEVLPKLRIVEEKTQERELFAAGFISYEAAPAFDDALQVRPPTSFPLVWFGLYARPEVMADLPRLRQEPAYTLTPWAPSVSRMAYDQAIAQVKAHIARGETYQVNYTFRLRSSFAGSSWALFVDLARAQQAKYSAYVNTGRYAICSASPELFFQLDGHQLRARPMKGTAARGHTLPEDDALAQWLSQSEKNRAENVMIVDMIRNDMGRVAAIGSVHVPHLFDIERYPTLWQMTSSVTARTDASLCDIMAALFPCASITGAPKPRTMQIIAGLETEPRRIYTGCIGFIAPGRRAQFNVAIRTVLIDQETGQAEFGTGGGIVWDSVDSEEYTECQVKARVLTERRPEFSLLETLRWTPEHGYFLLAYHLRRLRDSAAYFDFPANMEQVQARLTALAASLPNEPHKVRLLVAQAGTISCQATPLPAESSSHPVRLRLAGSPVDSDNLFLYHKTTHRQVYDTARAAFPDDDDVLLWNERGEITESCTANVVVALEGERVTPPVRCGLLPGTFRAWLLDRQKVREQVIPLEALRRSQGIYLINSVRKWRKAVLTI